MSHKVPLAQWRKEDVRKRPFARMGGGNEVQRGGAKRVQNSLSGAPATTTSSDYKRLWKNEAMPSPIRVQPSKSAPWLAPACSEARRAHPRVPRDAPEMGHAALQRADYCKMTAKINAQQSSCICKYAGGCFKGSASRDAKVHSRAREASRRTAAGASAEMGVVMGQGVRQT